MAFTKRRAGTFKRGMGGVIAFPPCTHLAVSGARYFAEKRENGKQAAAIDFFMLFAKSNVRRQAIENPVGIMSRIWKRPNQIIHPYYFGDNQPKKTCLWLRNLPKLEYLPSTKVKPEYYTTKCKSKKQGWTTFGKWHNKKSSIQRSKTFPGIARAMAEQWGPIFLADFAGIDKPLVLW